MNGMINKVGTFGLVLIGSAAVGLAAVVVGGCGGTERAAVETVAPITTSTTGVIATVSTTLVDTTTTPENAGAVGTRDNPVPIGQEEPVGPWKVKVVDAQPDANDLVLNHSEFNESPETGTQYVLVRLEATRTGEETAAFSADTYCEFVGREGTAFQAGFADIPEAISDTGEAPSGASVSGNLVFLVSSDQVGGGTLRLSEALSSDGVEMFFAIE